MYSEDNNRTYKCPKCGKEIIISIAQFEWCKNVHCNECNQNISTSEIIAHNHSKYYELMK
jgi:peptide subunit release factor 1 (eRF1)